MMAAEKKHVTTALDVIGPMLNLNKSPSNLKEKFLVATFEIVAEKGPEGLSASELIKRTDSSKGALFHHFKTLEELCFASLVYYIEFLRNSFQLKVTGNLKDCLIDYIEDSKRRQLHIEYFHLAHFFRDRAMKNEKYKELLREAEDLQINKLCEVLKLHLNSDVKIENVRSVALFFVMNLESIFYNAIFLGRPEILDQQISLLIQSTENLLTNSAMASSAK